MTVGLYPFGCRGIGLAVALLALVLVVGVLAVPSILMSGVGVVTAVVVGVLECDDGAL